MTANTGKQSAQSRARLYFVLKQRRRQVVLDRRPGSLDPFGAIERILARDTFSPAAHSIRFNAHQQDASAVDSSKARLKKMDEWHVNFT